MAVFEIKNLTFTYPEQNVPALKNINLTVTEGEFLLIFGKSGSGKTTLLNHFKTVMTPYGVHQGEILYMGKKLSDCGDRLQAAEIGYVLQNPNRQIVTDKVWHELAFGLENIGIKADEMQRRISETANFFGIDKWYDRDVSTLSGGQKQLLNLACVMVMQPKVLILDEPTSQLDPIAATEFLNAVYRINSELGTTVIMIEQRTESVFSQADRVIFMADGEIKAVNKPEKIFENLNDMDAQLIKFLPTPMQVFYMLKQTGDAPVSIKKGRKWLNEFSADFAQREYKKENISLSAHNAVEINDVWFRYEKNSEDVLKGATLAVPQGCIYAIIGGNGAGKSTLIKVIAGIARQYMGKVNTGKYRPVYLPQEASLLFAKDTVLEELQEMTADKELIDQTVKLCRIEQLLDSHPYDISAGQQQCAALAKVLLSGGDILLLDEVTKGMDRLFKAHLAQILRDLCNSGKTIIIVSHDIEFCSEYADIVGMFFNGTVVGRDNPQKFFTGNNFYTTAGGRMTKGIFKNTVNTKDIVDLCKENLESKN